MMRALACKCRLSPGRMEAFQNRLFLNIPVEHLSLMGTVQAQQRLGVDFILGHSSRTSTDV